MGGLGGSNLVDAGGGGWVGGGRFALGAPPLATVESRDGAPPFITFRAQISARPAKWPPRYCAEGGHLSRRRFEKRNSSPAKRSMGGTVEKGGVGRNDLPVLSMARNIALVLFVV